VRVRTSVLRITEIRKNPSRSSALDVWRTCITVACKSLAICIRRVTSRSRLCMRMQHCTPSCRVQVTRRRYRGRTQRGYVYIYVEKKEKEKRKSGLKIASDQNVVSVTVTASSDRRNDPSSCLGSLKLVLPNSERAAVTVNSSETEYHHASRSTSD